MRHGLDVSECGAVNEMGIVDIFTRLIFADTEGFSARERRVIAAFRSVDGNVLQNTPAQMGEYLRNLGVREMIHLVARIRHQIEADARAVSDARMGRLASR